MREKVGFKASFKLFGQIILILKGDLDVAEYWFGIMAFNLYAPAIILMIIVTQVYS